MIQTHPSLVDYYMCEDADDLLKIALHFQLSMTRTYASLPTNVWESIKNSLPLTVIPDFETTNGTIYIHGTNVQCRYYNGAKRYRLSGKYDSTEFYFYTIVKGQ